MRQKLLSLIAAASLLSMPVMAQGNGKAYGRTNTNERTTATVNGTTVRTHMVTNPAQTVTQVKTARVATARVHKTHVKKHAAKRTVRVKSQRTLHSRRVETSRSSY